MLLKKIALTVAVGGLTACVVHVSTGPVEYETKAIELDSTERVRATLRMGAGDLKVGSGTQKLMQAYFTYNVPSWKPEVRYSAAASVGELTVEQPSSSHSRLSNTKYEWDLRFSDKMPLDLDLHFGAGQAKLDLGGLNLTRVNVNMGVGQLEMDLRGHPKNSYDVNIHGGVGEATVRLPAGVGVYARANGGIGEIQMQGLRNEGGHWVNDAYGHTPVTIRVEAQGGIGSIKVIAEKD